MNDFLIDAQYNLEQAELDPTWVAWRNSAVKEAQLIEKKEKELEELKSSFSDLKSSEPSIRPRLRKWVVIETNIIIHGVSVAKEGDILKEVPAVHGYLMVENKSRKFFKFDIEECGEHSVLMISEYDAIEVHPVEYDPATNSYSQCDEDSENIALWSVYGHFREGSVQGGGLECLSDFDIKEKAEDYARFLEKALYRAYPDLKGERVYG
jgi:hypothetical protein